MGVYTVTHCMGCGQEWVKSIDFCGKCGTGQWLTTHTEYDVD